MVIPDARRDPRFARPAVRYRPGGPPLLCRRAPRGPGPVPHRHPLRAGQPPAPPLAAAREDLEDLAASRSISSSCVARAGSAPGRRPRRRAERRPLATVIENLPFEFWLCDADGRCLLQSGKSIAHWGDQIGKLPHESDVPADVRARWLSHQVAAARRRDRAHREQLQRSAGATSTSRRSSRRCATAPDRSPAMSASMSTSPHASGPRRCGGRARRGSRRRSRACPSTSGSATPSAGT